MILIQYNLRAEYLNIMVPSSKANAVLDERYWGRMLLERLLRLHVQEVRSDKLDGHSVVESGEGGV
jgi:hypothetical protein